ncbi:hypothetical protein, partial [Streptomyces sp. SID9727]|uniref:hypothetical protein n=1 Tax=Streptomyces sp. SID9727 TaxID=2706114 RepID=UPI0013CD2D4E
WDRAGARTGAQLGFDTALLVDAVDRQTGIELLAGPGTPLLTVTEPTETATAAAFAHTAVLAGKPRNAGPLAEAGRLFGRLAHLLDAVEDQEADAATGAWNPLTATGTSRAEARRLCDDALKGVRLALADAEFTDGRLTHVLLTHELRRSVDRAFATDVCSHRSGGLLTGGPSETPPTGSFGPPPGNPYAPTGPGGPSGPRPPEPPRDRRGLVMGCLVWAGLACTCQMCCGTFEDPWSRQRREGLCSQCDCGDCCDGCDACSNCCDCCNCCDGCDCGCDC